MKAASLSELKKELVTLKPDKVLEICLRLTKFKKDNKELLTYLLFESADEASYINHVKQEMDLLFDEMNKSNVYFVKKSIRKILRLTTKQIKYSGLPQTEVELLIHFCQKFKAAGFRTDKSAALYNLYHNQFKKINKSLAYLHEDLQYDYQKELDGLI